MSLVGWWKFDGDANDSSGFDNHGTISGVSLTQGKIGQAYDFLGTGTTSVTFPSTINFDRGSFSISMWAFYRDYTYPKTFGAIKKSASPYAYQPGGVGWDFGHGYYSEGVDVTFNDGVNKVGKTLIFNVGSKPNDLLNKWCHLIYVVDRQKGRIYAYVNGVKQDDEVDISTIGSIVNAAPITLGTLYGWRTDGIIDDLRIYDNVLSDKEIKELARAKILHYNFDDFQEPTTNLANTTGSLGGWTGSSFTRTLVSGGEFDGWYRVDITRSGVGGHICYIPYLTCSPNTTYTYSTEVYVPNNDLNIKIDGTTGYNLMAYNGGYKYYGTFTTGATNQDQAIWFYHKTVFDAPVSTYFYYKNPQYEQKDHYTPFTVGSRSGVVCDSSEYNNVSNLTTATPQWVSDSKLGFGCYKFNNAQYIQLSDYIMDNLINNDFSISFWLKSDFITGEVHDVFGGGNYGHSAGGVAFSHHTSNIYYYDLYLVTSGRQNITFADSNLPFNQWNHVILTRDRVNGTMKTYVNGTLLVLKSSVPNENINWNKTGFPLKIGKGYYDGTKGYIDDFRIYTTSLSDNDVKELYNVRGSLDNAGNLYVNDFLENPLLTVGREVPSGDMHYNDYYLTLTVKENIFLKTAVIDSAYTGDLVLKLEDNVTNQILKTKTIKIVSGVQTINIDWPLAKGTYRLRRDNAANVGLRRLMSDPNIPYITPELEIQGAVGEPAYQNYYYYFFNLKYTKQGAINEKGIFNAYEFNEIGPTDGLIGWWELDGNTIDNCGINNATLSANDITISSGIKNDLAYNLDGVDDYINIANINSYNFGKNDFSIGIWFNSTEALAGEIFGKRASGVGNWEVQLTTNSIVCYVGGMVNGTYTSYSGSVNPYIPNTWYHYFIVRNGNKVNIYLNGILATTFDIDINLDIAHTCNINIGRDIGNLGEYFKGKVNDFRIYNKGLTSEEVMILYKMGLDNIGMQMVDNGIVYLRGSVKEV